MCGQRGLAKGRVLLNDLQSGMQEESGELLGKNTVSARHEIDCPTNKI
jgi:hypothetical protein